MELQQHVPSGFTTHSQLTQEQFFNVRYTINQVLTFYLVKPCVTVYFIPKLELQYLQEDGIVPYIFIVYVKTLVNS